MKLVINGKAVKAKGGMTVLEVARAAGIYIPSLCYHPAISPSGDCRLCAVEVKGMRGLPCSCTLPAAEGMVVQTDTPCIREFRRTLLECILSEHPQTCLVCPANLRCELQEAAAHIGLEQVRLPLIPQDTRLREEGIFFNRDYNLCIRCGRCVRVCHELRGNKAIYFSLNEKGLSVGTPLNRSLEDSGCKFCGACVDICPTGALFGRAQRGLPEQVVTTVCPYCGVGCQLNLEIRSGKVTQAMPDPDGPANHGQACVKGRFGIAEFVHHRDRLTRPLIRRNGTLVEVDWDEALDVVASTLARYSGEQVAVVSSAKCTNEDNYVAQKLGRVVLHTNNIDHCARLCHAPTVVGLAQSFGSGAMTNCIAEIGEAACILAIGTNTTVAHPVIALEVKKAIRRGGQLIVVNPKQIELVELADLWLRHSPGSDVVLLMGMMRVIVDEGLQDETFIQERCENFEAFRTSLEGFSLDFVERITGVPGELVVQAARMFATTKPASILYAMGITQHSHGTDNVLAIANLAMLTGNVGKPSSGVNPLRGHNNVQGSCDVGALPDFLTGYQRVAEGAIRAKFESAWGCRLNPSPGLTLVEMSEAVQQGQIKAIYLIGENPALSEPDIQQVINSLDKLEFLVVQDIFLSETARKADVVLPACSFAEKDGTFTNTERRVQRIRKAISEIGDSKPDWWITCQIAQKMGGQGFEYKHPSEILEEISQLTPIYAGISYRRLERKSLQWPCPSADHPGTPFLHKESFARGKGRFMPLTYKPSLELPDGEFPFILTTGRNLYHFHTGTLTRRIDGLNRLSKEEQVEINPTDAQRLGIEDSELIKVLSRRGEVVAKARVTEAVPPGVVSMTFHFAESPVNMLTNHALDPVAKIPEYKVCAVQVKRMVETAHV
ncbi:MAG: formate dehydrogenase subunit alpha [Bacillota bacterium]|nr:formate dehydrogenase subunit alpha [Bacillota bacterium]